MISNSSDILFSLIVPVYNAAQYLETCIDSILLQSENNYEIIIVDDGSTDNSLVILDKYKNDERVNVLSKENGGVSSARNYGLNVAKGDYISFVDADDFLPEETLATWRSLMQNNISMAVGQSEGYTHDGIRIPNLTSSENSKILNCADAINDILYFNPKYGVCDKIFRADIINSNSLRFDEKIANFEDLLFVIHYLNLAENRKVVFSDKIIYNYRYSLNSATRTTLKEKHFSFTISFIEIRKYLSPENIKFYYHIFLKITASYISRAMNTQGFSRPFLDEYISLYRVIFRKYFSTGLIFKASTGYLALFYFFPVLVSQLRKLKKDNL
ncbi:glycosyltransferase [Erwinia psidii]|uniref:glycosyltransferase family 2 protein n=1 Tax=Erwinia psidii TaxID=69224 RepID=UPI00226B7D7C|nr:glycosyltransferase [Erwinia psidii]MCX8966990.1 glycosyltransferase [Erwinia psidii]